MILTSFFVLLFRVFFTSAQLPVMLSPSNVTDKYSCSSLSPLSSRAEILNAVLNQIDPYITQRYGPLHNCGGPGWTEVVNIDMSNGNSACPTGLLTRVFPIRSCTISGHSATATFPVSQSYSYICGRISAIQKGTPDAFGNSANNGTNLYVDGMTIRYGNQFDEGHIWTFASTRSQVAARDNCPCNRDLRYQLPSFMGSNYFCDSGNLLDAAPQSTYYLDNPLWDGEGCLPTSKCCRFNNPPWFYRELPASTTNSLKLDIQLNFRPKDEDIVITEMELYISP